MTLHKIHLGIKKEVLSRYPYVNDIFCQISWQVSRSCEVSYSQSLVSRMYSFMYSLTLKAIL